MNKIIVPFLTLALAVAIGLFFWLNEGRITATEDETDQKNIVQDQENKPETVSELPAECRDDAQPDAQGLVYYCIPEMGIKFKITQEMKKDSTYLYKESEKTITGDYAQKISFTTKSLSNASQFCSVKNDPLGSILKLNGKLNDYVADYSKASNYVQFDKFFIIYVNPQAVCTEKNKDFYNIEKLQLEAIIKSIKNIELI